MSAQTLPTGSRRQPRSRVRENVVKDQSSAFSLQPSAFQHVSFPPGSHSRRTQIAQNVKEQELTPSMTPSMDVKFTRIHEHKHFTPWEQHEKTVAFREFSKETQPSLSPAFGTSEGWNGPLRM